MDSSATKRVVLLVASLSSFLTPFMGSAVNIALPEIGREFGMDAVMLNWVATSYLLASAIFLLPFGRVADIYGRKKVFIYGIGIFTCSSLLVACCPSAGMLIGLRVFQGMGSAMIFGTGVAMLTSVFPAGERGRALGITIAAVYLGLSLGPFLGGVLTEQLGWPSVFLAVVPLGLIVFVGAVWKLEGEWADARGEAFDFAGSVLFGLALIGLMYGFSQLPSLTGAGMICAGVVLLLLFVRLELHTPSPLMDVRLFRDNRVFAFSNLAALINYSATFGVSFLLSLFLQYIKGFSAQTAGLVMVAQPLVMTAFSPLAGRLSDRVEPRLVASAGMALTSGGLLLLALLGSGTPIWFIVMSLLIIGLGFALFSSPNTNAVMGSVEKRFYGIASASLATMRLTGQMISMGIVLIVFAVYLGRVEITPEYHPAFIFGVRTAFLTFAVLCMLGTGASLVRGRVRRRQ